MAAAVHQTAALSTLFEVRRKPSFSVVLSEVDLKGMELQRQLEALKRRRNDAEKARKEELRTLRGALKERKAALQDRLRRGIDRSDYDLEVEVALKRPSQDGKTQEVGKDETANDNNDDETAVSRTFEIDFMKAVHTADLQDRVKKLLQEQTNDEIMRLYNMEGALKENFGEREAKMLSHVVQMDARVGNMRKCQEERIHVYDEMKERYEKAAHDHVVRVYQALRESPTASPAMKERKGRPMPVKSYSARVLEVNAIEQEERRKKRDSILSTSLGCTATIGEEDKEENTIPRIIRGGHGRTHSSEIESSEKENDDQDNVVGETNDSARSTRTPGSRSAHHPFAPPTGISRASSTVTPSRSPRLQSIKRISTTHASSFSTPSYARRTTVSRGPMASNGVSSPVKRSPTITGKSRAGAPRTNLPSRRVSPAGGN